MSSQTYDFILYCIVTYLIAGIIVLIIDCFGEGLRMQGNIKPSAYAIIFTWPFEIAFSFGSIIGYFLTVRKNKVPRPPMTQQNQKKDNIR